MRKTAIMNLKVCAIVFAILSYHVTETAKLKCLHG